MALELLELLEVALPKWYMQIVTSLDLSMLPDWLAKLLNFELASHAPAAFNRALQAVYEREAEFIPPRLLAEMDALAAGFCDGLRRKAPAAIAEKCDVAEAAAAVRRINMIPELVRMTCTMFGAWGSASESGNLLQLRALDFGSGPLANFTLLAVHRPPPVVSSAPALASRTATPAVSSSSSSSFGEDVLPGVGDPAGDLPYAFASLGFPGLVGVVTGISEEGIGLSEKVWEVYNTTTGVQPGAYDGEADVLVMRDVLELAPNRSTAEAYMRADPSRTWAVFLGVGDYATQKLDIVGYRDADLHAYTPETMPAVTGMPEMSELVYVDKHPQPSAGSNLPDLLQEYYGSLNFTNTRDINAQHETGDLHIAVYDFGSDSVAPTMMLSVGRIDEKGNYGEDNTMWKACFRPYLQYTLSDLWQGIL
jgi:hypothetical protein